MPVACLLPTETYISQGAYGMAVATWMVPAVLMAAGSMAVSVESALTLAMLNVAEPALALGLVLAPPDVELDPQAARTTPSSATMILAAISDRLLVFLMALPLVMASIIGIVKAMREVYEIAPRDDTARASPAAARPSPSVPATWPDCEVLLCRSRKPAPCRPRRGAEINRERSWQSR